MTDARRRRAERRLRAACCSRTTSRTRTRCPPSGASSSRAATARSSQRIRACSGCSSRRRTARQRRRDAGRCRGPAGRRRPPLAPRRPSRRRDAARRRSPRRWRSSRPTARTAIWRRRLDPLGSEPPGDPALERGAADPAAHARAAGADPGARCSASTSRRDARWRRSRRCGRSTAARSPTRSSTSPTTRERVWLRQAIESGRYRQPLAADERKALLRRLTARRGLRAVPAQGLPRPEAVLARGPRRDDADARRGDRARRRGGRARGRDRDGAPRPAQRPRPHDRQPYESILREFEGERTIEAVVMDQEGGTGDVKYHLPAVGHAPTEHGEVTVTLAPNPSHLEAVDPVIEGRARAEQTDRSRGAGIHDPSVALPILIHGDASFAGPGRRRRDAEPLEPRRLHDRRHAAPDLEQPGRLHHRSRPRAARRATPATSPRASTSRSSTSTPTIPRRRSSAIRLALAYRSEFGHDVVVDLVGYRRFGHNEQDEAAYTQPLMVAQIAAQATVARAVRRAARRRGGRHRGRGRRRAVEDAARADARRTSSSRRRSASLARRRRRACPPTPATRRDRRSRPNGWRR